MVYAHLTLQTPESQAISSSFKQMYGGAIRFRRERDDRVYRPPADRVEREALTIQANAMWFNYRDIQFPRLKQIIDNHPHLRINLTGIEDRKRREWVINFVSDRVRDVNVDLPFMLQACLDDLEVASAQPAQEAQPAQQAQEGQSAQQTRPAN